MSIGLDAKKVLLAVSFKLSFEVKSISFFFETLVFDYLKIPYNATVAVVHLAAESE